MSDRIERDTLGEVQVPDSALYAAQTQRAVDNFGLRGRTMPVDLIHSLALIKASAARANAGCGALEPDIASALAEAACRVAAGEFDDQFPVSVFQTGSGTSTNMNMNEVLARLASGACGRPVHANDHANASQSSNDVIPSAIQVAAMCRLRDGLYPALESLLTVLEARTEALAGVTKTGRTHLMDAMPITFGQELSAWACQLRECQQRFDDLRSRLRALPIGGSAVGTGVNVPDDFARQAVSQLSELSGETFAVADNTFSRMAAQDTALECSAAQRALAVALTKINNDLRWMSSGPLSGLAEITLQPLQPGSSIMPGKVNPVLPEAVLMVAADVLGNDASVAIAAQSGSFQLNVMLPLIAEKLCSNFDTLVWACQATATSVAGFEVNREQIELTLASNPILVTALNQRIGYEAAAAIAKRSYVEKRPVLEVAREETDLTEQELAALLDPYTLTQSKRK